jgi:hypothetical protein
MPCPIPRSITLGLITLGLTTRLLFPPRLIKPRLIEPPNASSCWISAARSPS